MQALTERAGQLGYAFADIEPVNEINREDLTVDLIFRIDEGPRVYVERIDIIGNVRTLDRVIRREFRLSEGDPYNLALLRRSEQRIRNLGYFELVDVVTERGSAPDKVIILTEVAEQSTGELSFGAGFSSADGPLGDVRLEERNLLGRGYELTASFTLSGRRQDAVLSFTDPWFLGYEVAAGVDLFRTKTDFQSESSFDETSTGGTIRANYPLTERLRHGLRYTLREDEIENVDNSASVFIQDEEGTQVTLADRPDLHLRSPRRALPAVRGLSAALRPGSRRSRRRQPVHPPRAARRGTLLDHSRRGLDLRCQRRLHQGPRRGCELVQPLLRRWHQPARLPGGRYRSARYRHQ